MLTGDLVRVRVKGRALVPSFVHSGQGDLLDTAQQLLSMWSQAATHQSRRRRVDAQVDELLGDRRDHKILRGFAKLLDDRSTWSSAPGLAPAELRQQVFRAARAMGPLALQSGLLERTTAPDVFASVAQELGVSPAEVADSLYGDLREEQRLEEVGVPSGAWLLDRYNVALVQALLLRATQMVIRLEDPNAPRMRQFFRYVKFHQLMHRSKRDGSTLEVTLDGPASMFRQSTRYGMQLANFFPALLLQEGVWSLEATVLWTRARHHKTLQLDHTMALRSHYRDTGAWRSRAAGHFEDRFRSKDRSWTLHDGVEPVDLGGRDVFFPDYSLRSGEQTVHLEIVGFWRKQWLERRLEWLKKYGPGNLVIAVSTKLQGSQEALESFPGEVISFAEILSPKKVIDAADRLKT
jgi:predicted nuclease of restriction endonuclease-like RecB superfamily